MTKPKYNQQTKSLMFDDHHGIDFKQTSIAEVIDGLIDTLQHHHRHINSYDEASIKGLKIALAAQKQKTTK